MKKILASELKNIYLDEVRPRCKELYVLGNPDVLKKKMIGIVGGRRASTYGKKAALFFAKEASNAGYVVVSGLARGIDGTAHEGALLGSTPTVAVLGHGLGMIYPPEHTWLSERIIKAGGCLISEYPPETPPNRFRFPERNRIIAALSEKVFVIEARKKSGSLITANFALELGKEVLVLPGPFNDRFFEGSHELIQQGAQLVRSVEDVLEKGLFENVGDAHPLKACFGEEGVTLEDLFMKSKLMFSDLVTQIESLKRAGIIHEIHPQKYLWIGYPQEPLPQGCSPRHESGACQKEKLF